MLRKILVVDDSYINRQMLSKMLSDEYTVLEAADGREALDMLERIGNDISAVLLDLSMPVMDGYEVLAAMSTDSAMSSIPVIVTTGSTEDGVEVRALALGANDFITKPYNPLIIRHRLGNTIRLRETAAFVNSVQRDRLTGLFNRETFFARVADTVSKSEPGSYVMASFNIANFKVINDQYGAAKGDDVLRQVAAILRDGFDPEDGICCRITADNFAVLYPREFMDSTAIADMRRKLSVLDGSLRPISFSIGRYVVTNTTLTGSAMYDRATIAEESVKARFDVRIAHYSESMRESILKEQEMIDEMGTALDEGQFEPWFQPQYNHSSGALIGAEALVRWRHPVKGLISPAAFIPVFERNGFIYELDKNIWEQICRHLRRWLDEGRDPLPVSVNVSRYDIFREGFFETVTGLIEKYSLPHGLLRIEITESAFSRSTDMIIDMVKRLTEYGITVEIDDFGSGYSSLNTLKDVPADVLKLDMRFLKGGDSTRGGNVLESVIRMAKWLGMPVIAEGVETANEADYLLSIGCIYVQGYLYARPMPLAEYEEIMFSAAREHGMRALETVDTLDNEAFWDPDSMETLIFNSYSGGACIFEYSNGALELLRVNANYAKEVSGGHMSVEDALSFDLAAHLDETDNRRMLENIEQAIATGDDAMCEVRLVGIDGVNGDTYIRTNVRRIARAGERYMLYCTVFNITEQRLAERREDEIAERLRAIMGSVPCGILALVPNSMRPPVVFANDRFYEMVGYTREEYEALGVGVFDCIVEEDRAVIMDAVKAGDVSDSMTNIEYRVNRRDGQLLSIHCSAVFTRFAGIDDKVVLAVTTDVTDLVEARQLAADTATQLGAILENVYGGVSATTVIDGKHKYVFASDRYYELFGYTREQFEKELPNGVVDLVLPEDAPSLSIDASQYPADGGRRTVEYRARKRDGTPIVIRARSSVFRLESYASPIQLTVSYDTTEESAAEERTLQAYGQLRFLNDIARDLLAQTDHEKGIISVLEKMLRHFDGKRAYIFEINDERRTVRNTYEACAPDVTPQRDILQDVPFSDMAFWFDAIHDGGYIDIGDVSELSADRAAERYLLEAQGIRSLIAVPLMRDGQLIGFIGVDDPGKGRDEMGNLQALGDFMAVMLTRRDLIAHIESDNRTLAALMNDTPGGFVRIRAYNDGRIEPIYINDGFCRLTGLSRATATVRFLHGVTDGVHPEDEDIAIASQRELMTVGETRTPRHRILMGDGRYIWVRVFGRRTMSGGATYFNLYYTDVSSEEQAEMSALEISTGALYAVMANSSDIAFVKDARLNVVACSRALISLAGHEESEDVIGKRIIDLLPMSYAEDFEAVDREIMSTGRPVVDRLVPLPPVNGVMRTVLMSKYPLRDSAGTVIGLYGVGRDITEERTAAARLKLVTDSMPGGVATLELTEVGGLRIIYCTDGFFNPSGYTREEFMSCIERDVTALVSSEDSERIHSMAAAVWDGLDTFALTYSGRRADGGTRWMRLNGTVLERREDAVTVNVVNFDTTEQHRMDEELRLREEEYRLAIENGNMLLYRYDHAKQRLELPPVTAELFAMPQVLYDMPNSVLEAGLIAPESVDTYGKFYDSMLRGDATGSMVIRRRVRRGELRWFSSRFSTVYTDSGLPATSIVLFEDVTDALAKDRDEEERRENERMLKLVAEHSSRLICRYDIRTGVLSADEKTSMRLGIRPEGEAVPDGMIDRGVIAIESIMDFRRVFAEIAEGVPTGGVRIHASDGRERLYWLDLKYSTLFNDSGEPDGAVISILDITGQHEKELAYERYLQSVRAGEASKGLMLYLEADVTAGITEKRGGSRLPADLPPASSTRDDVLAYITERYIVPQERARCRDFFSREHLLVSYSDGVHKLSEDWSIMHSDGSMGFVRSEIQLVQDPYSGHIKSYTTLTNITEEKLAAIQVQLRAETDGMTGLLNKSTAELRIRQRLLKSDGTVCALIIVDCDDLKSINDAYGHDQGDAALRRIANELRSLFRQTDIVARFGGDEFLVFMDGGDEKGLMSKLESLAGRLSDASSGETVRPVAISAGAAAGVSGETDFDTLFRCADKALYNVKANGKNDFAVYTSDMELTAYRYRSQRGAATGMSFLDGVEFKRLLEAVTEVYPLVISENLTQNTYYMMSYEGFHAHEAMDAGTFDELLNAGISTYHPEDRASFAAAFSRESLLAAQARGEHIITHVGRQKGDDGVYRTMQTDTVFVHTVNNDDVLAICFSREAPTPSTDGENREGAT